MTDKENIFIKKLKDESINEFENYIPIIESDKKIKEVFYYFLYNDLISIEINNFDNIDMETIINNPTDIIDSSLDNIHSQILNSDNNLLEEFKKELKKKNVTIKNKVNECYSHIEIIKKEYINISLQKYLPINNTKNLFSFENKTVLNLSKKKDYMLILGEFFSRIIFCSIEKKSNNTLDLLDLYTTFYDDPKINSYIKSFSANNTKPIDDFKDININFKYWIILLFLTGQIFTPTGKYYLIFNNSELNKYIRLLISPPKPITTKKKPGKPGKPGKTGKKTHKGGNKPSKQDIFKSIINNRQKKVSNPDNKDKRTNKEIKLEFYKDVFNLTYVKKGSSEVNLKSIYFDSFNKKIKEYFLDKLGKDPLIGTKRIPSQIMLNNPFDNKLTISLTKIVPSLPEKKEIDNTNIANIFDKSTFDLYQSLHLLINPSNQEDLEKFCGDVKYRLLLLLFYLYNIKLNIYKTYINKFTELFNNTPNNTTNNKSKKNESIDTDTSKNEKKNNSRPFNNGHVNKELGDKGHSINKNKNNSIPKNIKNVNIKSENINIDTKIKKKQIELNSLKDDNGIKNYDEKLLLMESELKNLIISKYIKQIKVKNKNLDE